MRLGRESTQAFCELFSLLKKHRELTFELARREISDRYSGQIMGTLWAFGHPLFMICLYVFVFGVVFKTRLGSTVEMPRDYTTYLLSGLVAWMGCQDGMVRSCTAITSHSALVKQVTFPLEVLPAKSVLVSLQTLVISLGILMFYMAVWGGGVPWTCVLLPVLVALQAVALLGIAYVLASIGVYIRDTKDLMQWFSMAGIYLIPVVYLPTWIPPAFAPLVYLNPFSSLIWCYQDAIYFGRFEHPLAWVSNVLLSLGVFVVGYRLFRKLKPSFGNVL